MEQSTLNSGRVSMKELLAQSTAKSLPSKVKGSRVSKATIFDELHKLKSYDNSVDAFDNEQYIVLFTHKDGRFDNCHDMVRTEIPKTGKRITNLNDMLDDISTRIRNTVYQKTGKTGTYGWDLILRQAGDVEICLVYNKGLRPDKDSADTTVDLA